MKVDGDGIAQLKGFASYFNMEFAQRFIDYSILKLLISIDLGLQKQTIIMHIHF